MTNAYMIVMTFQRTYAQRLRRTATLGAVALLTAASLTACGSDGSSDGETPNQTGSTDDGSALENASAAISENSELLCTGPAVFSGDDSGREALNCAWDYSAGAPPEGEMSDILMWSDSDVKDRAATLQADFDRPGGLGAGGAEPDWSHYESIADLGGYIEADGARGVCSGSASDCSDLADELGWTFTSNAEIAEDMKAFTGWSDLREAREDLQEKLQMLCTDIDDAPAGGDAAKCGNAVLTFGLSVDDLEDAEAFEGTDKADLSKVESDDWRMICRNDDSENCDNVAEYTGEEVTAL